MLLESIAEAQEAENPDEPGAKVSLTAKHKKKGKDSDLELSGDYIYSPRDPTSQNVGTP